MTVESIMEEVEVEVEVEVETVEVNEIEAEGGAEGADIEVLNSTWMLLLSLTTHGAIPRDH
jgi:hypothetical protein